MGQALEMDAIFRVDASPLIGAGHLIRCLALAAQLRGRGCNCLFLVRAGQTGSLAQQVTREGHELLLLPELPHAANASVARSRASGHSDWLPGGWEADAAACGRVLAGRPPADWLVVDHYALDASFEEAMRPYARAVFVIDDLADRRHECAYLLDQSFLPAMENRYAELVPVGCQRLLGPRYALLRPAFAKQRIKRRTRDGIIRRVLVCFGGFDAGGHTAAAFEALTPYASRLQEIDVLLGEDSPHRAKVQELSSSMKNTNLYPPAADVASLLQETDLAIGGGGTMTWERACLGVPTLAFAVADNQRPGLAALVRAGYLVGSSSVAVNPAVIAHWLGSLFQSPELIQGLSQRSASLVDGLGAQRVAAMLIPDTLQFRSATVEDSDRILQWRNDPIVRAASSESACIDGATHRGWLLRTLADPLRTLLIAEHGPEPIGVVRFDFSPPQAVISVYRVPGAPPVGGLVHQATMWLWQHHPEIRKVRAEVLAGNEASVAAFRNAGYRLEKNILVWKRHD
jgi:UDP-2,4-diacetamido-2,4,6-trideoxy-beta-L-altropyranose hydrolase